MLAFAAVAAVVTVTPGLDTLLVLRTAAVSGRRAALAAGVGIHVGVLCWAAAGALGVTALLTASRLAYDVLRWAGAAYLCWLGVRALWSARRRRTGLAAGPEQGGPEQAGPRQAGPEQDVPARRPRAAFRVGLTTNLLNPKVGVFYLSMLPQFLPRDVEPLFASLTMGAIHVVEGMTWMVLLTVAVARTGRLLSRPPVRRRINQLTGVLFVGFGLRLATEGMRA